MTAIHIPTPDEIKADAKAHGMSIAALCRHADVDAATYYRWRKGKVPAVRIIQKLVDTINAYPTNGEHNGR